jgi:hypothetical protein
MDYKSDIMAAVATRLGESSEAIKTAVIDTLVSKELTTRADKIMATMTMADNVKRDLRKIKPDQVILNLDGTTSSEGYSKAKLEEHKKLTDRLAKIEKAINTALTDGDYSKINELGAG